MKIWDEEREIDPSPGEWSDWLTVGSVDMWGWGIRINGQQKDRGRDSVRNEGRSGGCHVSGGSRRSAMA